MNIFDKLMLYVNSVFNHYRKALSFIVQKDKLIKIINETIQNKNITNDNLRNLKTVCKVLNNEDSEYFNQFDYQGLIALITSDRLILNTKIEKCIVLWPKYHRAFFNDIKCQDWKRKFFRLFVSVIRQVEKTSITLQYDCRLNKHLNNIKDEKQNFSLINSVNKLKEKMPELKESLDKFEEIVTNPFRDGSTNSKAINLTSFTKHLTEKNQVKFLQTWAPFINTANNQVSSIGPNTLQPNHSSETSVQCTSMSVGAVLNEEEIRRTRKRKFAESISLNDNTEEPQQADPTNNNSRYHLDDSLLLLANVALKPDQYKNLILTSSGTGSDTADSKKKISAIKKAKTL